MPKEYHFDTRNDEYNADWMKHARRKKKEQPKV